MIYIHLSINFKYPKAGEDNSLLAIKVFDLDNLNLLILILEKILISIFQE